VDTLAFGYILPTTGRIPDLHRLETCAAGRTKKSTAETAPHHAVSVAPTPPLLIAYTREQSFVN
ncbi:hypothetical protein, partial [Hungatella hathewayi]|uniref:hypothetical protein n=1 Tax=Hungatella hathewayi TaxID=154046 RepID=UPI001D42E8EE